MRPRLVLGPTILALAIVIVVGKPPPASAEAAQRSDDYRGVVIGPAVGQQQKANRAHRGSQASASVINGLEATPGSFPYMAFIFFSNGSESGSCSGTVVSSNVILTAAHCVFNEDLTVLHNPSNFTVVTGNVDRESSERTVSSVSRIAVNPNFAYLIPGLAPVRADAALLGLSAPISASPIRLATSQSWSVGTGAVMAGWGRTVASGAVVDTLHTGSATVQNGGYCSSKFSHFDASWSLCVLDYPEYRHAVCSGDSGGPLLTTAPGTTSEPLEIGIASLGHAGCPTDEPQYYTRADSVAAWVARKIGEWAPPIPSPTPPAPQPPTPGAQTATPPPSAEPPPMPELSGRVAKRYAREALAKVFHQAFHGRRAYIGCYRTAPQFRHCAVRWRNGNIRYSGQLQVFLRLIASKVAWKAHYSVAWVNSRCERVVRRGRRTRHCPVRRLANYVEQSEVGRSR